MADQGFRPKALTNIWVFLPIRSTPARWSLHVLLSGNLHNLISFGESLVIVKSGKGNLENLIHEIYLLDYVVDMLEYKVINMDQAKFYF